MQTTPTPRWKNVLWVLGTLAYGLGAAALSALAVWNWYLPIYVPWYEIDPRWVYSCVSGGLSVGLLAVGAWQVSRLRHKTAGCMLAVMAAIASVLFLYLQVAVPTGTLWWPGWLGVPNPAPLINTCHDQIGPSFGCGCACLHATATAEAPHPPAWLPWGH